MVGEADSADQNDTELLDDIFEEYMPSHLDELMAGEEHQTDSKSWGDGLEGMCRLSTLQEVLQMFMLWSERSISSFFPVPAACFLVAAAILKSVHIFWLVQSSCNLVACIAAFAVSSVAYVLHAFCESRWQGSVCCKPG